MVVATFEFENSAKDYTFGTMTHPNIQVEKNPKDICGMTPMQHAKSLKHEEIVTLFQKYNILE